MMTMHTFLIALRRRIFWRGFSPEWSDSFGRSCFMGHVDRLWRHLQPQHSPANNADVLAYLRPFVDKATPVRYVRVRGSDCYSAETLQLNRINRRKALAIVDEAIAATREAA